MNKLVTMKYITVIFIGIFGLIACDDRAKEIINSKFSPEFKGRYWTSEFYFYRNVYKFTTSKKGICYEHQLASSCPIDLEKYNISEDSMLLITELPFTYTYNDSILLISFIPNEDDTIPEREFEIIETSIGDFNLKSKYKYTYGNEVLFPEPKWFKCCL